jgi:dipicolinate synthase subunit A
MSFDLARQQCSTDLHRISYGGIMAELVIYQTDERMFFLRNEPDFAPPTKTHVFAPNVVLCTKNVTDVEDHQVVVGGRADGEVTALFNSMDVKHYNLLEDEVFQASNARLTAEGTVNVILSHSLISFKDMRVLVIGFGRTGSAVVRILKALDTGHLTVATTASVRPALAFADAVVGVNGFDFAPYDVVINTVPSPIISDKEVLTFKDHAIYVDLASKPALNLCFAKYLGIDAEIYPALPAKTAPKSAAKSIADYVRRTLK